MLLKQNTFDFLEALSANNDRTWFLSQKENYESARANVIELAESIIVQLSNIDVQVPVDLSAKKAVLRIYRDVRFSKNKDPYKNYFGVWFPAYGNAISGPGYYLHIEPNKSFLGAGYWMPSAEHLRMIRQEIDYNGTAFTEIVLNPLFKNNFLFNTKEVLLKAPKGYDIFHENIQYLKLKSFEVSKTISNEQLLAKDFVLQLSDYFKILNPYVAFLRNAIAN